MARPKIVGRKTEASSANVIRSARLWRNALRFSALLRRRTLIERLLLGRGPFPRKYQLLDGIDYGVAVLQYFNLVRNTDGETFPHEGVI